MRPESRPPLPAFGLGLAVLAAGAAVAPLTMFGLLAPIPAAVGTVLVLGSVVRGRGQEARFPTFGLAMVALGLLALLAAALQGVLLVDGLRYGMTPEGRGMATALLILLLAGALVAVLGGLRLRGVRPGGRTTAMVLLVPPVAALLFLLLSTVFPTRA